MNTIQKRQTKSRVILVMTRLLGGLSVTLLFAMMVLTFVDVMGRYFFGMPVPGGFEITEIMLSTLIFAGIPLLTLAHGHITVDLFDRFVPRFVEHIRSGVISFLCGGMMMVVSYQLWFRALDAVQYGDTTAILLIPMAPATFFMCAMSGLAALIFLYQGWLNLRTKQKLSDVNSDKGTLT